MSMKMPAVIWWERKHETLFPFSYRFFAVPTKTMTGNCRSRSSTPISLMGFSPRTSCGSSSNP
ncbi:hypothetical protein DPEC_G00195730 [Dallia pectoralis]|uniref:Uncharacterized protein n=1 Tax=Dallia pectoralis TaxID=75939 RepID=A0ACC2G759_DALPE|nr:hypothetical protein DPEC_G00195730 [Dallia pectoralis]